MDLTTRCPRCSTIFSASLEQLQLRKGYIRCINCAHIFDGYEAVVSGSDTPAEAATATVAAQALAATPAPAPVRVIVAPERTAMAPAMPPSVVRQRQVKAEPVLAAAPFLEPGHPSSTGSGPAFSISTPKRDTGNESRQDPVFKVDHAAPVRPDPIISVTARPASAGGAAARPEPVMGVKSASGPIYIEPRRSEESAAPVPEFLGRDTRYRGAVKLFWGVLTVAGLVLLLAQLVYVYRAQIANQIPALRPVLTQACLPLNCKVAYARRIDQISIMTSSLRASPGEAGASGSMTLQLTLRNTYDKPQEWPMLVLDLTDFSGTVVVRKNLAPANYLPSEALQQPFAASSEITVGVPIVLNDQKINGYQLDKFFP